MASSETDTEITRASILIIEDHEHARNVLVRALRRDGDYRIEEAANAAEARRILSQQRLDVVITDINLPDEDGITVMQWAKDNCPSSSWIVLTGFGTIDAAVKSLQLGAYDFFSKPVSPMAPLLNSVKRAIEHQRLINERDELHEELRQKNEELSEQVDTLGNACLLLGDQADTIRADLRRAALIQQALLPRSAPQLPDFQAHALYRPSDSVGGDLYDVIRLNERNVVLLIADAAGHGLCAAMLAVIFRTQIPLMHPESRTPVHPAAALRAVNRTLCDQFAAPGLFITAIYCLIDLATGDASIASAGHPPALLHRGRGGLERIYHTGPALGLYPDARFAQQDTIIKPGDRLLMYTDGIYDRFDEDSESPSERIAGRLLELPQYDLDALRDLYSGSRPRSEDVEAAPDDDVTLLMLSAVPGLSDFDSKMPAAGASLFAKIKSNKETEMLFGRTEHGAVFAICGRASWAQSAAFHEACMYALEENENIILDLTLCENLDSTFLGTIHELSEQADRARLELRVQGVMPPVEKLFMELGMERVLDRIVPVMLPLPSQMTRLAGTAEDQRTEALRVLQAHEGLASLNERNRVEFDPLLETLRKEVARKFDIG